MSLHTRSYYGVNDDGTLRRLTWAEWQLVKKGGEGANRDFDDYRANTDPSQHTPEARRAQAPRPPVCTECGDCVRLTPHHDDYAKPYVVRWLCGWCHSEWHAAKRAAAARAMGFIVVERGVRKPRVGTPASEVAAFERVADATLAEVSS